MENKKINSLCLSGFIVSMVSLLINFAGLVGMTGMVLSIVGLNNLNEYKETGKGMAIAGIVVGAIGVIYGVITIMTLM